jgi:hypothetical protein
MIRSINARYFLSDRIKALKAIRAKIRKDGRGRAKALAEQWAPFIGCWLEKIEVIVMQAQQDDRMAIELARQLEQCADGPPCNLSICPLCVRKMRKSLIMEAVASIDELGLQPELPITKFSGVAVISRQHYARGMLGDIDLCQINRYIQAQHERAGFPLAFAAVEILLNDGRRRPPAFR